MKRLAALLFILLTGCATPAQKEMARYVAEVRPLAGKSVPWSQYYEGAYARASAVNAPADILRTLNELIRASQQYERGEIDQETFAYRQRGLQADGQEAIRQAQTQEQAQAAKRMALAAQIAQASAPRVLATAPVATSSPTGLVGFLQGDSINGMLRYCKYSNGVVNTVRSVDLCPINIQ